MPEYGLTALLADDSESARMVLTEMLSTLGFKVLVATDAFQAKKLWDNAQAQGDIISLLVIDWKMPGMNGLELIHEIKDNCQGTVPSVVMVTSHGAEVVREALQSHEIDGLLIKPIGISALNDAIAEVLQQHNNRFTHKVKETDFTAIYRSYLENKKILLVEDNEINMDLAIELLKEVGVDVSCANNGLMATEMVGQNQFDLVLMDIQMPVLDGLSATREIRKSKTKEELPIIAMTAHAIAGESQKSIDAGMNDHITKPIDPSKMYRSLIHTLHGVELGTKNEVAAKKVASDIKLKGLAYDEGLKRAGSNAKTYHSLLLKFASKYTNTVADLRSMVMKNEMQQLIEYMHTLAGVSGNLGANEIYNLSHKLSVQIKAQKENGEQKLRVDFIAQMQLLSSKIESLIREINDNISAQKTQEAPTKNTVEIHWPKWCEEMQLLLSASDFNANGLIEQAIPLAKTKEHSQFLISMQEAIADFEFENAAALLQEAKTKGLMS